MNRWFQVLAVAGLFLFLGFQGNPLHDAASAHPALTALVVLLSAWAVSGSRVARLRQAAAWMFRLPRLPFNLLLFAGASGAYAAIAWFLFKGIPRTDDGMASLFQARLFARGAITLPLPPDAEFFEAIFILGSESGLSHWCGMYPPGWPLLLTPGVWLAAPWLVNPVLGGLLIVVIAELGRNFYNERTGRLAALMALPSPLVAVLAGLHLSHVPTALAGGLCLLSLRKLWATSKWFWGGAAGLFWGIAFLCRPLDAAILGALFACGFFLPPSRFRTGAGGIAAGLTMALLAMALLLGFQKITTGDWMTPGHEIGMGPRGQFGFVKLDEVRTHTPAIGLRYTFLRLKTVNENMLGWPIPALLLVLLPFALGGARGNGILLLLPLPALLLTYAFYWYYESCVPARYVFSALPFLFVLAARGWFALRAVLASRGAWARLPAFLLVSGFLFLAVSLPEHFRRYGPSFYDVEDLLPRVVRDYGISHAVVFMDSIGRDSNRADMFNDYYATGFMRNDLDLQGDILYARNSRQHNVRLVQRHPDRTYWLYRFRRDLMKAYLYRLVPEGDDLRMIPVKPATPDLIEAPGADPA